MNQLELEEHFSKKTARDYVYELLLADTTVLMYIERAINLLEAWADIPATYTTKQTRKDTLKNMNTQKIVENLYVDIMMSVRDQTLANISTQLGVTLGFAESREGITLAAEIIAVVSKTGFYNLIRYSERGSYYVVPTIRLEDEELQIAHRGMYMPPLIDKPRELKTNRSSPYLTVKSDSLILRSYNHHEGNIGIDVINIQNRIPLKLHEDFIKTHPERPTKTLDDVREKIEKLPKQVQLERIAQYKRSWYMHLYQSNYVYNTMYRLGNKFYIPHKDDKRGRLYAQGYHIDPQGTSYKKAIVELHNTATVEVPKDYFND